MHEELRRFIDVTRARLEGRGRRAELPAEIAHLDFLQDVAHTAEFVTIFDHELRILFNNHRQLSQTDARGSSLLDWVAPEHRDTLLEALAHAYVTGLPHHYEVRAHHRGVTTTFRTWVMPLTRPRDDAFIAISLDVSHVDRVERELADQTGVLDMLVRSAPDHIMVLNRQLRVEFVNHLRDEFTTAQVIGAEAFGFVRETHRAYVKSEQEAVLRTGQGRTYEAPLDLADGTHWYSTRAGPIVRNGQVERVLLISTDITEAKRAEAAAAEERTRLDALERVDRRILGATELGPVVDGVLEEIRNIFGGKRACLTFPCQPDAASWSATYERCSASEETKSKLPVPVSAAHRAHMESALTGSTTSVWTLAEPDPPGAEPLWQEGVRCVWSLALRPATSPWLLSLQFAHHAPGSRYERNLLESLALRLSDGLKSLLAQRDLRQSEERFRILVEHAPEAITIVDVEDWRFVEVNANAEKLFGLPRAELLETDPIRLIPQHLPDGSVSASAVREMLHSVLQGGSPTLEWALLDARGQELLCEVRAVRLPHPERKWVRVSLTDITARKRTESENRALSAQLAQAQKMQALGQLTGGIAHDFNNLLTVIIGSLAMIEVEGVAPSVVREMARHADAAAQRAAALTQRLLAFSRRQPLRPESIDLRVLLPAVEQLLRRILPETIALQLSVDRAISLCEADPVQLESAILNLAINARDAMPKGGTLHISAANAEVGTEGLDEQDGLSRGDYVLISVSDSGTGMAPEVLAQAFEPFFTTKGVGQGSGLGLSMVYGFAKQSGGQVKIRSQLGHGTEVCLHLPRSKRKASSPGLMPVTVHAGRGQLLLVVEDDPSVRQLVCEMLHRLQYRTISAEHGRAALALLRERPDVDLMLTDMALPGGMSGAELVGIVRAERPTLPVLFMTGYSDDALHGDQRGMQGIRLLAKPFSNTKLAAAVEEALRDPSSQQT